MRGGVWYEAREGVVMRGGCGMRLKKVVMRGWVSEGGGHEGRGVV